VHTEFLAGVVLAWVVSYIGIGIAFCVAYLIHRREPEDVLFGLHSLALALYSIGVAFSYGRSTEADAALSVAIATAGVVLATGFFVHFAVLYARVKRPLRFIVPVYVLVTISEIANVFYGKAIFLSCAPATLSTRMREVSALHVEVHPTMIGTSFCLLVAVGSLFAVALIGKAVVAGRREGIASLLGAALMTASFIHDALLAPGYIDGVWLGPFGATAFVFGICGAFLVRSSRLRVELTHQSLQLKERSTELRRSYDDLREAQSELARNEQLAAIGELAAVIAHEVRNPLAIISNAVAGLKRSNISHEDRDMLIDILKEESSRLNRLVGDLLRFARPIAVHRQLMSIHETIERSIGNASPAEGIAIDLRDQGQCPDVWADPSLVRQLFDNLVDNALQAMSGPGEGHHLRITVRPAKHGTIEGVSVDVTDTGDGMDPEVCSRAKKPFFTTRPSGTGLGLAIVDRIVGAHGGNLLITSERGTGTTVEVFLPMGAPVPPVEGADRTDDPFGDAHAETKR
jgi:signal transduction histidine kinase